MAGEYRPIYNYVSVLLTTLRNKKYCVYVVLHFPGTYCSWQYWVAEIITIINPNPPRPTSDAAEKLFDLVDSFAESAKRKAAVWPLQIILLVLCPEITQTISREVVEESKANKVSEYRETQAFRDHTSF